MILVTGGAGYIGSLLTGKLLESGYSVRVLDKFYFGKDSLREIEDKIEIIQSDIRDFDISYLENIEAVIHLADLSNDPTAEFNPKANHEINYLGTVKLAEMCKAKGVRRFIYASSCSVYYNLQGSDEICCEDTPVNPAAPYSKSKHNSEKALIEMADENFCPVMLRKGTVFGQSPRMRYDLVVNTFCLQAYLKGRLTVQGNGDVWRPLVHIQDVCNAYAVCLKSPEDIVRGQVFNVLHKNYRILDLAHQLKYILRDKKSIEVDVMFSESEAIRSYRVSSDKAKYLLGLECSRGLTEGVQEIWSGMTGKNLLDLNDPIYYNIRWMKLLVEMEERIKTMGYVF